MTRNSPLKRTLTGLMLASAIAVGVSGVAPTPAEALAPPEGGCLSIVDELPIPSRDSKATLCHFTGSDSNPFIINEVSVSAADSHNGHHGDCVKYFDGSSICF